MNYSALIDWRAGVRVAAPSPRPAVGRLERRAKKLALRVWLVLVHLLAGFGALCLVALVVKSCGA